MNRLGFGKAAAGAVASQTAALGAGNFGAIGAQRNPALVAAADARFGRKGPAAGLHAKI